MRGLRRSSTLENEETTNEIENEITVVEAEVAEIAEIEVVEAEAVDEALVEEGVEAAEVVADHDDEESTDKT